jgi:serine-type D-Ala-D-Ala carboxypeptidase/endopeptidase (penicillin-binding protein 4)
MTDATQDDVPRHMAGASDRRAPGADDGPRDGHGGDSGSGDTEVGDRDQPHDGVPVDGDDVRRERTAPPRWRRWVLPGGLALVVVAAGGAALALDAKPASSAVGAASPTTPVLSARRAPEVLAAPVAQRRLAVDLQSWLVSSPADTCLVVEAQGDPLFEHNPTAPLTGASTQKLLTATGLLLGLGPDARLETRALAAAAPTDGVVAGDLFVVGGGDATLGTPGWITNSPSPRDKVIHDVDGLVDAIVAAGVTRIDGAVVGDGSRYDGDLYNDSLAQRFVDQDQVGPIGGLMVNDGFALFSPEKSYASTVPAADPAADAARVITDRLRAKGVAVGGAPRSGRAPASGVEVASLPSAPVSHIVAEMLTHSDNETAEAAVKEVGLAESGDGSWAAGAAAMRRLLADGGVPLDGVEIVDGSGLSSGGQLTCGTLVDVLTRERTGPVIRDGLAVAGQTGTLATWKGTSVDGRMRGKTGTLRNATALAGRMEPLQGGTVTFAYVANVPEPGEITSGQVRLTGLADILVGYPRGVDLATLQPEP